MLADYAESLFTATVGGRGIAKFKGSRFSFKAAGLTPLKIGSIAVCNHGKSGPKDNSDQSSTC